MAGELILPEGFSTEPPDDTPQLHLPEGFSLEPPKLNFFERFGDDLKVRFGEQGADIISRRVAEEQGFMHTAIQLAGKVGGGTIMDFLGEVLISGGRGLATIAGEDLTDSVKQSATKAGVYLLNTDLGKKGVEAAYKGMGAWMDYKEENPIMAESIEALVNIGLIIAPVKGKPRGRFGVLRSESSSAANKVAQPLERAAAHRAGAQKSAYVDKLVKPKETIKSLEDAVERTKEIGSLGTKVTELDPLQKLQAAEIRKIPGINPKGTLQGNYNVIAKTIDKKARALEAQLTNLGPKGKYHIKELEAWLDNTSGVFIRELDVLRGNPEKIAESLMATALRLAETRPHNLRGLLQARREFRTHVEKQIPNIHDQASNATSLVFDNIAREMNKFAQSRIPRARGPFGKPLVRMEESLKSQSLLLEANKVIRAKAAKEGRNKIARMFQSLLRFIPIRNELIAALSVMFGLGGLGAAGTFGPLIQKVAVGYGIVAGTKGMLMAPGTRTGVAQMIRLADKALRLTTDVNLARQLRLQRAALVQLLEDSIVSKEAEEYKEAQ